MGRHVCWLDYSAIFKIEKENEERVIAWEYLLVYSAATIHEAGGCHTNVVNFTGRAAGESFTLHQAIGSGH